MTKKRFLIAIAIVMVLILSVAVFVACNENQTKSYTVKFVDGESEIKSSALKKERPLSTRTSLPTSRKTDTFSRAGTLVTLRLTRARQSRPT